MAYDFNTRNVQFYLNGSSDGSFFNSFFSSSQADTQPLFIGRQGWDCACNYFSGSLDEVRIWGLERTSAEIALSAQFPPEITGLNGLNAYYDFEEGSGTTLNDKSLNNYHGTLVDSPTWNSTGYPTPNISPATSNWVEFDGATDYIDVPAYTDGSSGAATIEAWIRPEQATGSDQTIINFYNQSHRLVLAGTALRFIHNGGSILSTDFTPYFGEETHVAVSITSSNQKMYVNGVQVDTHNTSFSGFAGPLRIGAGTVSDFNGKMTDIRIWNDVRTGTEIQSNISSLLTGSEANLRAFYRMSEGSGTTLGDHSTNSFSGIFHEGDPGSSGFTQKSNFNGPKWTTDPAAVFPEFITISLFYPTEENRTGLVTDLSARIGSAGSPDAGITYSLSGTDASFFSINSSNGQLSVTTELDFDDPSDADTDNNYEIVVSATAGALVENRIYVIQVTNTDCTIDNEAPGGAGSGSGYFSINADFNLIQTFQACATGELEDIKLVANVVPTSGTLRIWPVTEFSGGLPVFGTQLGSVNLNSISWNNAGSSNFNILTDIDLSSQGITLYEGQLYAFELESPDGRFGRGPNTYANGTIYHDFGSGTTLDIAQDMVFKMDIIEADNTAPQFLSAAIVDFDEETTGTVLDVDARDEYSGDSGTPEDFNITYSISGTDAALFDINTTNGVITFLTPPDFEIPSDNGGDNVYDITVTANDGLSSMQNIAITVQNTFESVTFTNSPTASVPENSTTVTTLTEQGANPAGTVTFSISGGDDQTLFSLTGADLSFTVGPDFEVPGDNEGDNTYEVQVTVDDTFTTDDLLISVTVTDEDEAPVDILLSNNTTPENGAVDDFIGTLSLLNPDAGDTHTYLINGTTSNSDFKISGDQLLANRAFDFETEPTVDVDITARDGIGQELTETFSIAVSDANDAPTDIQISNTTLAENATVGTSVATLTTTDVDPGDSHTYSLPTGYESNDFFEIVGSELRVLTAVFDFETDTDHIIRIETNDGNGGTYQEDFTVNLTDLNEDPVFTTDPSQSVDENISMITTLEATDEDAGSTLTFSISGGDDQDMFDLNGSDLSFLSSPDFEAPGDQNTDNVYEVQVSVFDGTNTVDLLISVSINNVDEPEPPLVATEGSPYEFAIDPIDFVGSSGNVTAPTLPDWLTLDFPQIELVETLTGSEATAFRSVESTVFGEDGTSYVLFTGGVSLQVAPPIGDVTVINLSGFDPFASYPRRIAVDPAGNVYISDNTRIVRVEPDETHTTVTSSLTGTKDIAWHPDGFMIVLDGPIIKKVETNGTITNVVSGLSSSAVAVSVSSNGDMFYGETGTFDPMNVDENIYKFQLDGTVGSNLFNPSFDDFNYSTYDLLDITSDVKGNVYVHFWWTDEVASIYDRIDMILPNGVNSEVVSLITDVNNKTIVNMTTSPDNKLFYIDAELMSALTYIRSFNNFFNLSGTPGTGDVGANDVALTIDNGVDPLNLSFTIDVDYINDDPTDITLDPPSVDEGLPVGSLAGLLTATDLDNVHGDTHTFAFVAGTGDDDNAQFTILGNDLLSNAVFDNAVKSQYTVRVEATDARGGVFSKALSISILDVNSVPTDIALSSNDIDENGAAGTAIGNLSTTDADVGDTFTYTLVSGAGDDDNASFTISGNEILSGQVFDFESQSSFSIRVQTDDNRGGLFEEAFMIVVNNLPESPANISLSNSNVDENEAVSSLVGTLEATDPDGVGTIAFSLSSGVLDNDQFSISGNELLTAAIFDFETQDSYQVEVTVGDGIDTPVEETFTISVNDLLEGESQTITFDALQERTFGDTPFDLVGEASSGQQLTYTSSNEAVATISGNTVFINGAGTTDITASQSGGNGFLTAEDVVQTLTVNKAPQTISFLEIDDQQLGADPIALNAASSSGMSIQYSVTGPATILGNSLTITGVGEVQVTATQAGNENFLSASLTRVFVVTDPAKTDQVITFDPPAFVYVNEGPVILEATSTSGLEVSFEIISGNEYANISGDNLNLVSAGTIEIAASQAGNESLNPAVVTATIEIRPVFSVSGTVTGENGNAFSAGDVVILDAATGEGTLVALEVDGSYTFNNLKEGSYYVTVFADDLDAYYNTLLGSVIFWLDATVLDLNSDLTDQDIQMVAKDLDNLLTGNGIVTGRIVSDDGTGGRVVQGRILAGDPIEDVSVFLIRNSDDQIMTEVVSDANGDFEITGIPEGEYRIQVEVTGVAMELAGSTISIDAEGTPVVLTAMVGEDGIVVEITSPLGLEDDLEYTIYPNPATEFLQVEIKGEAELRIYTLEGKEIFAREFVEKTSVDIRSLGAGIYILEMSQDGVVAAKRFMKHN